MFREHFISSLLLSSAALAGTASAAPVSHRLDSLSQANVPLQARVVEGQLVAESPTGDVLYGDRLQGARIEGERARGGTAIYEIARVIRDPAPLPRGYPYAPGTTMLYYLRYRDVDSGHWKNLCGPDAKNERWAVALAGYYDAQNTAHPDERRVTFACTRGVIAKCYRWGYRPWLGEQHAAAHQACVRMVMADYCGDGRSWTRDGTLIHWWDNLAPPVQPRAALPPKMRFEAAWAPTGAACFARPRWTGVPEQFRPGSCTKTVPVCASEQDALREHGGAGVLLFNASYENSAIHRPGK